MSNNFLRQDSNGTSQALRSKLQGLGAGTYDPEFMKQYRNVSNVMAQPKQSFAKVAAEKARPSGDQNLPS